MLLVKMVNTCAVFGCTNRSNRENKSFFLIPTVIMHQGEKTKLLSAKRRDKWMENLNRNDFIPFPPKSMRLFSEQGRTRYPKKKLMDNCQYSYATGCLALRKDRCHLFVQFFCLYLCLAQ